MSWKVPKATNAIVRGDATQMRVVANLSLFNFILPPEDGDKQLVDMEVA